MALSPNAVRVVHPPRVRVLQLCDYESLYAGSFVPGLAVIRNAVEDRGWDFEAVFGPGAEDREWYGALRDAGMRVRVSPELSGRARLRWLAALVAERRGPVLLHTHFAHWDVAAALVARRPHGPAPAAVVWHRHGILSRRPLRFAHDAVRFGLIGRLVDAHLCVGPAGRAQLIARGVPPHRALLFPNPTDVRRFAIVAETDRRQARAALGVEPDTTLLVAFTWRWELKGGPLLIELVRELVARGRHVTALVVGGGPSAPADAQRHGVEHRLRQVEPRSDPRIFFAAADVFVAPGIREGFGYAPLEAVCCGTPVVASDIPGHRHFGQHLPAIRLTAPSPVAMAEAVEAELAADPRERQRRVSASREYLERHAGPGVWAERLLHVYEKALARRTSVGNDRVG